MYILIVEDDPLQAELMIDAIKTDSLLNNARIERISTESHFRQKLDEIVKTLPNVITMDIMLRWADASPAVDAESTPEEVREKGIFEAGLRCERLLASRTETQQVPVILYTIVSKEDLGESLPQRNNLLHLPKDSDLTPLILAIRDVTRT